MLECVGEEEVASYSEESKKNRRVVLVVVEVRAGACEELEWMKG